MGDSSRCAQVVVTELLGAGVQEVVLSPGSRSAPLAYELFEADKIGLLRLHVRIDERTAGFLALGLAKASERPVAVVTTSGTAAANLHPAVLEAFHSHIPLVAMTADRPRAARFSGGNQTTDQAGLFARHVRAETQIDDAPSTPRSWRFELGRVLTAATGARSGTPGPVHLNLSFSEPLVPGVESAPIQPELRVTSRVARPDPVVLPVGPQTLVVAGALSPSAGAAARAFAEQADLPLLAESVSNARGGPNALATGRLLLRTELGEEIERVVMFGHPTLARPVIRLLGREDIELVVVASTAEWIDPGTNARLVTDAVALDPADDGWRDRWSEADEAMSARLAEVLDGLAYLSGPVVAGRLWSALGGSDTLVVGSSSPARDLDLAPVSVEPPSVYANRGLAGIDGTISTAVGVGLVVERPTHALIGDETFLHDTTGLIVGRHEQRPDLRIVVANDNGGAIFATLEHGHPIQSGAYERIFGTPHDIDLERLATSTGAGYRRVETGEDLAEVLAEPPLGIEVVEAVIDRRLRRVLDNEIGSLTVTV
ncbi:MAG TPA: 2-succinyl-5-enolpyruvyl-6-hydroxy-3-cyclohexene-1-carboxylic-acid synthase [Microlunatus sp.]|nr:2-succinyl-5-enolpyruvyl-6-hydroxy-3-cyclohexene-1-carboxylic-acid synthase [Microlunatus sp.]